MANNTSGHLISKKSFIAVTVVRIFGIVCGLGAAQAFVDGEAWTCLQLVAAGTILWCASFHIGELMRPIYNFGDLYRGTTVVTPLDFLEWIAIVLFLIGTAGRLWA